MARADKAILEAYDNSDGATDGVIADQRNIKDFDVQILRNVGFTPAQLATFDLIRQPHRFSKELGSSPGYPVTHVAMWSSFLLGSKPPPWPETDTESVSAILAKGAPYIHVMADTNTRVSQPARDYAQVKDPAELTRLALASANGALDTPAVVDDFAKLSASGARMIVYHGVDDQAMSYLETVQSYEALAAKDSTLAQWMRVFTVPGLLHCRGGTGPTDVEDQLVEALVSWVEQGQAPDTVVTNRISATSGMERNFRLCAEPKRAVLKGAGLDFKDAKNWECRAPTGR